MSTVMHRKRRVDDDDEKKKAPTMAMKAGQRSIKRQWLMTDNDYGLQFDIGSESDRGGGNARNSDSDRGKESNSDYHAAATKPESKAGGGAKLKCQVKVAATPEHGMQLRSRQKMEDTEAHDGDDDDGDDDDDDDDDGDDDDDDNEDDSDDDEDHDHDNDDDDDDDDDASDEGKPYDEDDFRKKCREDKYEDATRTKFEQLLAAMKKWAEIHAPNFLPMIAPFPVQLCYRYVHFRCHETKKGRLAGPGTLYGITLMLKHEGYVRYGHSVPAELVPFFKDAHGAHKKRVLRRIGQKKQEHADFHAQNAPWRAVEYCAEQLHDGIMPNRHASTHLYFLGSVQNVGRGERMGKIPLCYLVSRRLGRPHRGRQGFDVKDRS